MMFPKRVLLWIGLLALVLSACTAAAATLAPSGEPLEALPTEMPVPTPAPTEPRTGADVPPAGAGAESLKADFEIALYQGADVLGGERVMLSDVVAQGKPVVLNFYAGLCPLCRAEMAHLQKAYETYGDRVLIVAVDIGPYVRLGDEDDARALLDDLRITFPAGSTPDGSVVRAYNVLGTPANLFVAPTGEIVERFNGVLNEDQLNTRIEALIAASGTP